DQKDAAERIRAASESVQRSKERLEIALAASDTGTFKWEPETDAVEIDDNLMVLLGLRLNDRIETLADLVLRVHPDDRPRFEFVIDASRAGADFELEFRVSLPKANSRCLYARAKLQKQQDLRPACFVGACTDITSRKQAEE